MAVTVDVLIVDDSTTARLALQKAMEGPDGEIRVVGQAATGEQALKLIQRLKPSIVTIDVHLGGEDGVELAAHIMETSPLPILIVTGIDPSDPGLAFRAMQAGALEVLPKLHAPSHPDYAREQKRLMRMLTTLSKVPVVTRRRMRTSIHEPREETSRAPVQLVAIGASTGGPPLLQNLLSAVPSSFDVPIAIVQHIAEGFAENLAEWLRATTGHKVVVCEETIALKPGHVYLASDRKHMLLLGSKQLVPDDSPAHHFQKPSIDKFFDSVALGLGGRAVGVLLTGMGRDGAAGLLRMRRAGASTAAQTPGSCVIDSMPQSAIDLGAASEVLSPNELSLLVKRVCGKGA